MIMDSNNKLFKYNFIQKISTSDIDAVKKAKYQKFHEDKYGKTNLKSDNFSKIEENNINYHKDVGNRDDTSVVSKKSIIAIDSRFRDYQKFPHAHYFDAPFGKTFKDVKSIRLISTEIPNSDQVIKKEPDDIKNNVFYWENTEDKALNYITNVQIQTIDPDTVTLTILDHGIVNISAPITIYNSKLDTDISITGFIDGTYIGYVIDANTIQILYKGGISGTGTTSIDLGYPMYSVEFKPGNYTATTLTDQIEYSINFIRRQNGVGQYHYFEVNVNLDTDVITFDSVITDQLASNPISTTAASETITVASTAHGLKTGDRVKMIDVKQTGGIAGSVLSGDFIATVLDFNTFTYEVNTRAIESTTGGGNTVKVGTDAPFRFLLDTQDTLIQYNTGFADEDSSQSIGSNNSFSTYVVNVSNVEIIGDYLEITTTVPHQLDESTTLTITNITSGYPCEITTNTPHNFEGTEVITIRDSNSSPNVNGDHAIIPTGVYTFTINTSTISSGNSGEILYNGDRIAISGLRTRPRILEPSFYVENITTVNKFRIRAFVDYFDADSVSSTKIRTSQLYVNHPNHGFNITDSIQPYDSNFATINTLVPFSQIGSYNAGITVIDGPVDSNALDILLTSHGLETSDEITIINSTTNPTIDGVYKVQVVTNDIIRINFVHASFVSGTTDIFTGDKINISKSNSLPKVDGYWYVINQTNITAISTGISEVTITVESTVVWNTGDDITISSSDSIASIDGDYQIKQILNSTQFTIDITDPVILSGTTGKVVNKKSGFIYLGFEVLTGGTYAILGRKQDVIHYRVESEVENSDTLGGISLLEFNNVKRPVARIIDKDNYMIRAMNAYATHSFTGGGNNIKVSSELHGFRSIQANTDTGEKEGDLFRSISLEGENYIYLVIPGLDTVSVGNSSIKDVFAKIVLTESPGLMCFNSFISAPKEFDPPLSRLDQLTLSMIGYTGYPFNFNDLNYSLSFEIIELSERLDNTNLLSNASTKLVLAGSETSKIRVEEKRDSKSVKASSSDTLGYGRFGTTRGGKLRM